MLLEEVIRNRRTIHSFTDEKIPDEVVHQALELSLWAPNHKLTFPWRYIQVGLQSRAQLAELAISLKIAKSKEPVSDVAKQALREALTKPSHFIALSMVRSSDEERLWEDFGAVACGVQIISLTLWQNGIGSKWTTSGYSRHARTYEILGIDPSAEKLVGGLLIGKPLRVPPATPRPPLNQFLKLHD